MTPTTVREEFLPFALPSIGEEEISEVVDSLRSGWITTGSKVKRFESDFAEYVGSKHAIAVNSCTAGLHIALTAMGIGPGDEVIVPTLTFCSTANVVVHLGARPILIDVNEDFNISIEALDSAISSRTKAIMPVHYGGQACDLDSIHDLANSHDLIVVEDAAHAVGADYRGRKIGSDALRSSLSRSDSQAERCMSVFSFYAIKNMTTGEGGMIATSNDNLAKQFRLLAMHGMSRDSWNRYTSAGSWHYEVVMAGYKCNMTDIQASLGIHQLRKLDGFINRRTHLAQLYSEAFADVPELDIPIVHDHRKHAWHLYVIRLRTGMLRINRAQFIDELKSRNIGTSVHFIPVHLHPFYQRTFAYRMGDFPVAESIYERIVSLPLYPQMTDQDVTYVADSVLDLVKQYRK